MGGAGGEPIGGEPSVEPAPPGTPPECVAYCEAAAIRGCPKVDDCESSCSLLFGGFCDAEVAAFLECSPSLLNEECIVGYPEDWLGYQCLHANDAALMCNVCNEVISQTVGLDECISDIGCGEQDYRIHCYPDGQCDCWWENWLVGTCETIFSGFDGCIPALSCCVFL